MNKINRVVSTSFWDDETVVNEFSPEDKYFYLYLLTNPHTTQLGIYRFVPKVAAFELGYSIEAVIVLLERFENKYGMIRFNKQTSEIAIKNYLRHSIMKGGKPVYDCLLKEESLVKDKSLLEYIYINLSNIDNLNITVKDYINHIREVYIKDNDNDNERIVVRIVDESSESPKKPVKSRKSFTPPTEEEVKEYCLQNDKLYVDPESFVAFYGSKDWFVGKNKMKDWHMAVSGWNARAKERGEKQKLFQKKIYPYPEDDFMVKPETFDEPDGEWVN